MPFALHIIRPIGLRKRMEMLVRDFLLTGARVGPDEAKELMAMTRAPVRAIELSRREKEILTLLAMGSSTRQMAAQLHISTTTVNNHVQHIFRKLSAHTRLEAIRRAEHAGLI